MIPKLQDFVAEFDTDPKGLGYKNGDNYKSTKELCNLLGKPQSIPNPTPQPQVLKPFTLQELLGLISDESLALMDVDAVIRISDLVDSQDRTKLGLWVQMGLVKKWLTQNESTLLTNRLSQTYPDPTYSSTILGPSRQDELEWKVSRERINESLGRPLEAWN